MAVAKTHLSLTVRDIDQSVAWYQVFFGEEAHKRRVGYANFDLENPPLKLALQTGRVEGTGALNHLGILVADTSDVLDAKTRLEQAGLVTFTEENVTCCYAKQDKIWVRDPDGNAWEVYALLDDMLDDDHEEAHGEHGVGCCQPGSNSGPCCENQAEVCCS